MVTLNNDTLIVEIMNNYDTVFVFEVDKSYSIDYIDVCDSSFKAKSLAHYLDSVLIFPVNTHKRGFALVPIILNNKKIFAIGDSDILRLNACCNIKESLLEIDFNLYISNEDIRFNGMVFLYIGVNLNDYLHKKGYEIPCCLESGDYDGLDEINE